MLCVWKMEGVSCVIEHSVERHLLYVVCIEDAGGSVCDRAWCGASPAICCVYRRCRGFSV